MTLPRTRLLARLSASEPRLVRLLAPAGYAKSSLARLFARRFERHAICDCAGVADATSFANRALASLAEESQPSGDSAAWTRLHLHAIEADAATWSRALLEAWKSRHERALFIFEHAEAIAENNGALVLLGDLLAARPSERVILVSSRAALPIRVSHYFAAHQILTLSANDLRFNDEEAASLFEATDLAPETVSAIVRLADGWPIVLLLLALVARYDANIERLVERLSEAAFADLHEQLASEVLSAFTPDMMSTVLAMVAIPNASLEDIAAATGIRHATPIIDRLLHLPGFISSETGAYQAHPLVLGAIRAQHGVDSTNRLLRAAEEYERSGDFLRAAELYSANGNEAAAAAALDRLPTPVLEQPSARLIDAIAKIRMSTLCAYPNLWIATLAHRRHYVEARQLYGEALKLLQSLAPDARPLLRRRLRVRLALFAQELEKLAEARELLEVSRLQDNLDETPEEQRLCLMTSALVAAKRGRFAQADELVDQADAVWGARHLRFDAERTQIAMEKARLLGDWNGVLKISEEELYAAQRSGVTSRIIDAARAVASAAWYCNDDERVTAANQLLEDCGDADVRAFARHVEATLSRNVLDAPIRILQVARWHAALATADAAQAKELLDQAIDEIDTLENDFLQIAIRVGAALLLPVQRRRLLEARAIAARIESPPLHASLELLIDSTEPADYGVFTFMAARAARSPLKIRHAALHVNVARGQVRRGAELVHVSERGFELLVALALLPVGTPKEHLGSAIWPGLDGDAALNALKMCVSRTRAQVADKEAIRSTKGGYALSEDVAVDVHEFERLLRNVRGADVLSEPLRRQVQEAAKTLEERERVYATNWEWFVVQAAALDRLQHELTLVLAKDAWKRNDVPVPYLASEVTSKL